MSRRTASLIAALLAVAPTVASAQSVPDPDSLAAAAIERLKAGKNMEAISGFLGQGKLGVGDAQLAFLADQIGAGNRAYGPILGCEMVERKAMGTMAERRLYLCQHTSFVTRWSMVFMRTGEGWRGVHFSFDDKLPSAFEGLPVNAR